MYIFKDIKKISLNERYLYIKEIIKDKESGKIEKKDIISFVESYKDFFENERKDEKEKYLGVQLTSKLHKWEVVWVI